MRYSPSEFVWRETGTFVPSLVAVTVAPGMTAPVGSVTLPVMLLATCACAFGKAHKTHSNRSGAVQNLQVLRSLDIVSPPSEHEKYYLMAFFAQESKKMKAPWHPAMRKDGKIRISKIYHTGDTLPP